MGRKKRSSRRVNDKATARLVEGLDLSGLDRLAGACADIGNKVSYVRNKFRDGPLDPAGCFFLYG